VAGVRMIAVYGRDCNALGARPAPAECGSVLSFKISRSLRRQTALATKECICWLSRLCFDPCTRYIRVVEVDTPIFLGQMRSNSSRRVPLPSKPFVAVLTHLRPPCRPKTNHRPLNPDIFRPRATRSFRGPGPLPERGRRDRRRRRRCRRGLCRRRVPLLLLPLAGPSGAAAAAAAAARPPPAATAASAMVVTASEAARATAAAGGRGRVAVAGTGTPARRPPSTSTAAYTAGRRRLDCRTISSVLSLFWVATLQKQLWWRGGLSPTPCIALSARCRWRNGRWTSLRARERREEKEEEKHAVWTK